MSQLLLIRADAGPKIGTGHVMRCLALAQAWQDTGGNVTFATAHPAPRILERLQASGVQSIEMSCEPGGASDLAELRRIATQANAAWVVVDGYAFDETYQRQLKEASLRVLFLDDYGQAKHYWADIVLNQNLGANADLYQSKEPYTQLLLGNRYVLLRREFLGWRDWQRVVPDVAQKVLVTLGGSDPADFTLKVIQALLQFQGPGLRSKIVVGPLNPHSETLRATATKAQDSIELLTSVTNMPELMAWADVAISAGGTTASELAFMGLPSLLIVLAENQRKSVETLAQAGIFESLGWHRTVSFQMLTERLNRLALEKRLRNDMSSRARALVDGLGSERVLAVLKRHKDSLE